MTDQELIRKSVTRDDYSDSPQSGIINFLVPYAYADDSMLPPAPPNYWTPARDYVLRNTIHHESMWSGAVSIAITKMASLDWLVESDVPLRSKRAQDMLVRTMTVKFLSKHLQDYLNTDNGAFVEIVRATRAFGSRILGLVHLDSLRCRRTGDPDIPVIYRDKLGREHEMKAHQVITMSDMPDPSETFFGVGHCAASRAYKAIYKLAVMERYISEKVSGKRPLAIHFVNAVSDRQLESAVLSAEQDNVRKGYMTYMGAIVVPLLDADHQVSVATVPLAELPDGFQRKEEFDIAILSYANDIGLDVQDLQPLTGQPLGTGAQSQVLDDKGKGKGLVAWRQEFTHNVNWEVMDDKTTFAFNEMDFRDQLRQVQVSKARAEVAEIRTRATITSPEMELQLQVEQDELPKEFLDMKVEADEELTDDEKPEAENAEVGNEDDELDESEKSLQDVGVLINQEMEAAQAVYEKVIGE